MSRLSAVSLMSSEGVCGYTGGGFPPANVKHTVELETQSGKETSLRESRAPPPKSSSPSRPGHQSVPHLSRGSRWPRRPSARRRLWFGSNGPCAATEPGVTSRSLASPKPFSFIRTSEFWRKSLTHDGRRHMRSRVLVAVHDGFPGEHDVDRAGVHQPGDAPVFAHCERHIGRVRFRIEVSKLRIA